MFWYEMDLCFVCLIARPEWGFGGAKVVLKDCLAEVHERKKERHLDLCSLISQREAICRIQKVLS